MQAMGIMGFIFGMAGLALATTIQSQLASLRKEFEDLKKNLESSSGILKEKTESEDK